MSQLVVFVFPTEDGADAMRDALDELHARQALKLDDAAVVVRTDDGKVRIKQATDLVGMGALGGTIWGALVGLVFLSPWLGMAVGAVAGALAGRFTDIGIDDAFIRQVGQSVGYEQSALFLLIDYWEEPAVVARAAEFSGTLLRTASDSDGDAPLLDGDSAGYTPE